MTMGADIQCVWGRMHACRAQRSEHVPFLMHRPSTAVRALATLPCARDPALNTALHRCCRSPILRVMSAAKEHLGIMSREAALQMAVDENLNLVLEDELADPPVCRIVEAARYVYEQNKRGTKKNQQR